MPKHQSKEGSRSAKPQADVEALLCRAEEHAAYALEHFRAPTAAEELVGTSMMAVWQEHHVKWFGRDSGQVLVELLCVMKSHPEDGKLQSRIIALISTLIIMSIPNSKCFIREGGVELVLAAMRKNTGEAKKRMQGIGGYRVG
jgi:hypothetical protein